MWAGVRWSARTDPRRSANWWRTAPQLAAVTASALPFLLPPALMIWPVVAAYRAVERVAVQHASRRAPMPLLNDLVDLVSSRARRGTRRGRDLLADRRAARADRTRVRCPECGAQHWHRTPRAPEPPTEPAV
jgi:hypothetical protein